jgi:hypothetical protein
MILNGYSCAVLFDSDGRTSRLGAHDGFRSRRSLGNYVTAAAATRRHGWDIVFGAHV